MPHRHVTLFVVYMIVMFTNTATLTVDCCTALETPTACIVVACIHILMIWYA